MRLEIEMKSNSMDVAFNVLEIPRAFSKSGSVPQFCSPSFNALAFTVFPAELAFPVLAIFVNYAFLGFALSSTQLIGAGIILVSTTWLMFINRRELTQEEEN